MDTDMTGYMYMFLVAVYLLYFTIYTIFYICFFPSILLLYSVPTVSTLGEEAHVMSFFTTYRDLLRKNQMSFHRVVANNS